MYQQKVKDWSASIPACLSVRFGHEKASLKSQVSDNQTLFRVKKRRSGKQGCLRSSLCASIKTFYWRTTDLPQKIKGNIKKAEIDFCFDVGGVRGGVRGAVPEILLR